MEYWMASNETGHGGREEAIQEVLRDPGSAVLFVGYPRWILHFAASCCIIFMLVGIPGNLFTIVALIRTRKLRNATAIFIINLSVSDLMFCCFNLPLATSTFWHSSWHHGELLCRLFPLLRYGLVAVSLFTVLAITINRFVMIGHPRFYPKIYKPKYLIPMVLSTWILGFGFLVVTWFEAWGRFGLDVAIGSCSILPDANGRSPKEFLFVVAFLIPCVAIVVCYARIFYIVRRTACKSRRRGAATSDDTIGISQEGRSLSPRNQEEELSLSVLGSSCPPSVLCADFTAKHPNVATSNRADYSRTPSRSAVEESLSEQEEDDPEEDEEENGSQAKYDKLGKSDTSVAEQVDRPNCHRVAIPRIIEICDTEKTGVGIRTDEDIPYVDDLDTEETVFSSIDRARAKEPSGKPSVNGRNKFERMASRASFIIDSAFWVQRLNSKASNGSDRLDSSRSNSPDGQAKRRAAVFRRASRFKSVGKLSGLDGPPRMGSKDRKLLKMILVIFSSFLLCYLPITVTKTFKGSIDWRGLNIAGYILIYLTTCINPVVYVVMSSEYRSAYKNLLLCRNDFEMRRAIRKPQG